MSKFIITIVFAQAFISSCLFAQNWESRTGEEDWGETVYASQTNSDGATITIFTAKETFKPAMLISPYKPSYGGAFAVEITIDNGRTYKLKGQSPEYFDEIYVDGIAKQTLNEMKIGNVVTISVAGKDSHSFSLSGSSNAIGRLDGSMQKGQSKPSNLVANKRPTLVRLNSVEADQKTVILRWSGSTPSMEMSNTNSGNGWEEGYKESPGVYIFSQEKFYNLRLDFNDGTFVEGGFDGGPLPDVSGTFSTIE